MKQFKEYASISLNSLIKRQRFLVFLLFLVYLLIGLSIFDDYGISWDEPSNRMQGIVSYNYLFNNDKHLLNYKNNEYGVAFHLPLVIIEKILNLKDSREIYLLRHLLTFISFYISSIFFFLICKSYFRSNLLGFLGTICLILSPRIFAHSFYNSKDLVFLSFFIISIFTLISFLKEKNYSRLIYHSLTSAFVIDIRITGILIPALTIILFIIDSFKENLTLFIIKKSIINLFLYILITIFFTILFWPYLWESPLVNFIEAYKSFSKYNWGGEVLFMGDFMKAKEYIPWYYSIVWLAITTPIFYIINFLIGISYYFKKIYKEKLNFILSDQNHEYIILLWFFCPLITVILLKSALYDGWRHLFFIYPAFIFISLRGISTVLNYFKNTEFKINSYKTAIISYLIISLLYISYIMINTHPYQNVYFNMLAGKNLKEIKQKYDLDYWGLSYKQALEYLVEKDIKGIIKINCANDPCNINSLLLKPKDRQRIKYVELNKADYFLSNFRKSRELNKFLKGDYPYKNEIFSIIVDGGSIVGIYKLN